MVEIVAVETLITGRGSGGTVVGIEGIVEVFGIEGMVDVSGIVGIVEVDGVIVVVGKTGPVEGLTGKVVIVGSIVVLLKMVVVGLNVLEKLGPPS